MIGFLIYFFPFAIDIVLGLVLFVGRHSLAARGASQETVGTVLLLFGLGYVLAGPIMRRIIDRRAARAQMALGIGGLGLICVLLSQVEQTFFMLSLFALLPFLVSLFFNAFQAFMLGVSTDHQRPLRVTVSLYTISWSLGLGMGPFVCAWTLKYLSWHRAYLLAALVCCLIMALVLLYRNGRKPAINLEARPSPSSEGSRLHFVGWMGIVIGLTGWVIIATYWPVIAAERGFSAEVKGLVEFSWAGSLSFGGFLLMLPRRWHYRTVLLPLFGLFGVAALVCFGGAENPASFVLAAALMGFFSATTFVFSLFHCMVDQEWASRRVAVNEMMVGVGYLVGPVVATLLLLDKASFSDALFRAAGVLAVLVAIQSGIAMWLSKTCRASAIRPKRMASRKARS